MAHQMSPSKSSTTNEVASNAGEEQKIAEDASQQSSLKRVTTKGSKASRYRNRNVDGEQAK